MAVVIAGKPQTGSLPEISRQLAQAEGVDEDRPPISP
jgi:hypothetical protein